jgi:hypothetical protein
VTFRVDEGLERESELGWQLLFAERSQEGHRGLIGVKLREAAGTALEVLIQLPLDRRRELVLEIIRQQADQITALAGSVSHGVSNAEGSMPDADPVHSASSIQH